jgi:AcrR family transcriptional regulator
MASKEPKKREAAPASKAPRRRLSAVDARRRILEAAEKQLMKVGPEGLRLTDLARTLGVSHPAILHHFGSREGLVGAVVRHALDTLNEQLIAAFTAGQQVPSREAAMDMVAEVYGVRGSARLLAWLLLSGRTGKPQRANDHPLKQLADTLHGLHVAHHPRALYEDTLFELQLVAIALLGDAIFGDAVRRASGVTPTPAGSGDFRRRLASLLSDRA